MKDYWTSIGMMIVVAILCFALGYAAGQSNCKRCVLSDVEHVNQ